MCCEQEKEKEGEKEKRAHCRNVSINAQEMAILTPIPYKLVGTQVMNVKQQFVSEFYYQTSRVFL